MTKISLAPSHSSSHKIRLYFFSDQTPEDVAKVQTVFELEIQGKKYNGHTNKIFQEIQDKPLLLKKGKDFKFLSKEDAFQLEEVKTYHKLGMKSESLGDYYTAIDYHQQDLKINLTLKNRIGEGIAYLNLGNVYDSLGNYREAIKYHEKHLKIALDLQDCIGEGRAYCNLGIAYRSLGYYHKAIKYHEKSLKIFRRVKDLSREGIAYLNLGYNYNFLGDYHESIEYHNRYLKITLDLQDRTGERVAYDSLGSVSHSAGNYLQALEFHKKALIIALEFQDTLEEQGCYINLGNDYTSLGKYQNAIEHYEKGLTIALEFQNCVREMDAYNGLGIAFYHLGEHLKAIEHHQKGLIIALKLQDHVKEGKFYGNLGNNYDALEEYYKAIEYHKKHLKIALKLKDKLVEGSAYTNLGIAYQALRNPFKAIKYYEKSLTIAIEFQNKITESNIYCSLGIAYHDLMEYQEAINYHKKDLVIASHLQDQVGENRAYCNLGNAYCNFGDYTEAEKCFDKSIEIAAILQQNVKHSQWKITLFEKLSTPYIGLEKTLLLQGKATKALEISDTRKSRALASLISEKYPLESSDVDSLTSLIIKEMQELSEKLNTTFVIYSLVNLNQNNSIQAWIITSQQNHKNPISIPLSSNLDEFKDIDTILKTFPYGKRPRVKKGEKATDTFKKHLSQWYELLIAPLEPYLLGLDSDQGLTFISDGFLAHLPFGAFYSASDQKYLIEKHPISFAPSIKILYLLEKLPSLYSEKVLLIGNPTTSCEKDNNLKFTEIEIRETLVPLMKVPSKQVFIQENATVENMLKEAPFAQWIHIACHGVIEEQYKDKLDSKFDPHSVFKGFFKLAPDETHPFGLLHSEKIASMSLKADLVFMSACHLGRGNLKREGSIGPIWSFLGAGAKSTIASYWPLPDSGVTVQMVETFYKHLLGIDVPKLNKAQALREAILMGMRNNRDNIEQWGAFFLSGLIE
ncbi:MAG: tetratricopeptide repeat protein [Candidatus Rhabdochlamydia sp.]